MASSQTEERVIELEQVWAGYSKNPVLQDINLTVHTLDYIGIIGPNGGGKTTLFKVLLGLLSPQRGRVSILGRSPHKGRRHIGYVPQSIYFDQTFPICVWEVVQAGRLGHGRLGRRFDRQDQRIVKQALDQVGLLDLKQHPVSELSGGQLQRAYIARALATEPQILLLDEPTANLDSQVSQSIYDLLWELNQQITIVMISHDIGAVSSHVKTVACLNQNLYYHGSNQITSAMLKKTYGDGMEAVVHRELPQRVLAPHESTNESGDR
ncbi:MAG: metal ABC transporter ATP-binding protein [Elainellaceae cyanobacterium]